MTNTENADAQTTRATITRYTLRHQSRGLTWLEEDTASELALRYDILVRARQLMQMALPDCPAKRDTLVEISNAIDRAYNRFDAARNELGPCQEVQKRCQ